MISTMNTRTGNAQSRGVSQIQLEEDAMLTAIGRSSIDEMADKYADRWEDFVAAMSRWRSLHQLLRLGQLNKTLQNLTNREQSLKTLIAWQDNNIKMFQSLVKTSAKAMEISLNPQPYKMGKSGRKPYDAKATIAVAEQGVSVAKKTTKNFTKLFTQPLSEWQEDLDRAEDEIELASIKKRKGQKELDTARANIQKTQDQYDATKSYAMGLLVADIFYTLASAIRGEIYL